MKSVATLMPPELDYWVARAEGIFFLRGTDGSTYQIDPQGTIYIETRPERSYRYTPSSDWRLAGPIIQQQRISLQAAGEFWIADCGREHFAMASQPLIAAMRVRVALAFGDNVNDEPEGD